MSSPSQNAFESMNDGSNAAYSNADMGVGDCNNNPEDYDFTTASGEKLNLVPTCASSILLSDTISKSDIPVEKNESTGSGNPVVRRDSRIIVADSAPLSFEPNRQTNLDRYSPVLDRNYQRNLPARDRAIVDRPVGYPPYQQDSNRTVVIIGDSGSSGWGNTGYPVNRGIPDIFGGDNWPGTPGINPNTNPNWNWGNRPVWGRGNGPTYQYPGSPGSGGTYTPTIPDYTDTQNPGDFGNNNGGNGQTDQGWDPLPNDTYTPTDHGSGTQDPGDWGNNNNDQNGGVDNPTNGVDGGIDNTNPGYDPLPNDTYTPTDHGSGTQDPGDWGNNNNDQNGGVDNPTNGTDGSVDDGTNDPTNGADGSVDDGTNDPTNGADGSVDDGTNDPTNGADGSVDDGTNDPTNGADGSVDDGTNDPTNGVDGSVDDGTNDPTNGVDGGIDNTNPGYDPLPNDTYTPTDHGSGTQDPGDFGNNNQGQDVDDSTNNTDTPVLPEDENTGPTWDPLPNDTYTPTDHGSGTQEPGDFGNNNGGENGQGDQIPWNPPIDNPNQGSTDQWIPPVSNPTYPDQGSNIPWNPPIPGSTWPVNDDYYPQPNDTYTPIDHGSGTQEPGDFGNNNGGNGQTDPGWDPLPNDTYTPTDHGSGTQEPGDFGSNNQGQDVDDSTNNPDTPVLPEDDTTGPTWDPLPNDTYTPTDHGSGTQDPGDFGNNNQGQDVDDSTNNPDTPVLPEDDTTGPTWDPLPNDTYTPTDHGSGPQDPGDFGKTPIDIAPVQPFLENGAGLNFNTPTEFAANGNVPDFILNSNGQLTPNPAKDAIGDDGVIDIQVNDTGTPILANPSKDVVSQTANSDDAQSRAEKDANEAQKAKIQDLIRHYQKNNPGKPIPQEWTDVLNSVPETPQSNGNNETYPGYDPMPYDTYTPNVPGYSGPQDTGNWGGGNGASPNQTPVDYNEPYYPSNNQGGGSSQGQPNLPFLGNRDYDDFRRNNGILPPGSNGSTLPREYINNPTGGQNPIQDDWRVPTSESPNQNTQLDRQPIDHEPLERNSSIEGEPTITPEKINEVLTSYGSPAAGMGQHIYDEGVRTGINPALALAVFAQETGAGTEGHSPNTFNIGDIRSGDNPKSYSSIEQGITDWFNTMDTAGTVSNMIDYQTSGTDTNSAVYLANVNGLMESWDAPSQCETINN